MEEFLIPVSRELVSYALDSENSEIGSRMNFGGEIKDGSIVIFGAALHSDFEFPESEFDELRKELYRLKVGDWTLPLCDLGDLKPGKTYQESIFSFLQIQSELLEKNCILIILGGKQDFIYWQYRAFDNLTSGINLSCIDCRFGLNRNTESLTPDNFLGKIIMDEPRRLLDYTHLGYQTYFVAEDELELMDAMNFEVKRLGILTDSIKEAEPELRISDMVALNMQALQASDFQSSVFNSPNGFDSREICSLARYAGISNKIKSFGVYNYKAKNIRSDDMLMAELLWYFIEGKNKMPEETTAEKETFYVQQADRDLIFQYHIASQQWWLRVDEEENPELQTLIPCSEKDYRDSLKGKIPDRYWRAFKKYIN